MGVFFPFFGGGRGKRGSIYVSHVAQWVLAPLFFFKGKGQIKKKFGKGEFYLKRGGGKIVAFFKSGPLFLFWLAGAAFVLGFFSFGGHHFFLPFFPKKFFWAWFFLPTLF